MSASYLALGDSYTIGEGVDEGHRWPRQLAAGLRAGEWDILDPRIIATTGWTTGELSAAIAAAAPKRGQDLVTLLAGVNDQYRGHSLDAFRESFGPLASTASSLAKLPRRLIVLSIPDWGVTPYADGRDRQAIGREIDSFNSVVRDVAGLLGAVFVDVTPASRLAATDRTLLVSDGLHPSAAMYRMWVDQLLPIAAQVLSTS